MYARIYDRIFKTGHVICIAEGTSEEVIIKKLFNNNKLIFKDNDKYLDEKLIRSFSRTRQGAKFAKENLEMDYGNQHINIVRILDSRKEGFQLGKIYEERRDSKAIRVFNILTRPEIEMLIIINQGCFNKFTNKSKKIAANIYCKEELKMKKVKSKDFISKYYDDIDRLLSNIESYKQLHTTDDELCTESSLLLRQNTMMTGVYYVIPL